MWGHAQVRPLARAKGGDWKTNPPYRLTTWPIRLHAIAARALLIGAILVAGFNQ